MNQIALRPLLAGVLAAASLLPALSLQPASASPVPASAEAAADTRVKWNPGHYVLLGGNPTEWLVKTTLSEIADIPQVKGVMSRYMWRDLETSRGVYNFSKIDRDLNMAAEAGKKLFVILGTKTFQAGARAVPDYLHTAEYGGGVYRILVGGKDTTGTEDTTGENVALWDADVRERLIALTTALGRRYNRHPAFEGLAFNETSPGTPAVPLSTEQRDGFYANLAQVNTATRQAFPNTVVLQFINYPKRYLPGLVDNMLDSGVGLGGPDTFLNDDKLELASYPNYDRAANQVPLGPSVQAENYVTTYQGGPYAPPAVKDLFAFARGRLHANYLFWSKTMTEPLVPYNNVLRFFNSSALPKDAAGGLNAACPATFSSCVPEL